MKAIEALNLRKAYGGTVQALDGMSLSVEAGTIFALLGPNGAGKSTTVKILTTLTKADEGEARVAGLDVARQAAKVRRMIGVVGQKQGFDRESTGRENLKLQAEVYNIRGAAQDTRVDELLEQLGLEDAADRITRTYSGGMQRRLDVALGLINRPQVLFLDEPTTGLDPEARADMWHEIERLARDERMTILLTTHYLEEADNLASQLAIIDRGRVVAAGSPDELKHELHGDRVEVELAEGVEPALIGVLEEMSGVSEAALDGNMLRARTSNGGAVVPAVISALEARGCVVASVAVARPSLDDVYLRHAGRSFANAEREGAPA